MEKKFGKSILLVFIMVSIFGIGTNKVLASNNYINYNGIEMTDTEYTNLVNLGFSEKQIYYMDERTYLENKDFEAVLLDKNTKYYKTVVPYYGASYTVEVTPLEYFNHGNVNGNGLLDYSATYYYQIVSTISYKNATKYRYKIEIDWLNIPDDHSFDVIGIGFDDDVYINSPIYFRYIWAYSDGSTQQSTLHFDQKSTAYGGSTVYELPPTFVGLNATMFYDVSKDTNDTLTSLQFCGDYAHAQTTVTIPQAANHAISVYGIGFDPTVYNYFDAIPCTYGNIAGISW